MSLSNNDNRVLIVGNPDPVHIGAHLLRAANKIGLQVKIIDTNLAFKAPWPIKKYNWWLRGHHPTNLRKFSQKAIETCQEFKPKWLLSTGLAPLDRFALEEIGSLQIKRLNYLTDDPFNPKHATSWFFQTLPLYDHVFSPRSSNIEDLREFGCNKVSYLPFAYDPQIHFPDPPSKREDYYQFSSDVFFAGNADNDRIPFFDALLKAGFKIALYGYYWNRFVATSPYAKGYADPHTFRKAIGGAKVAICLVRRANRDGHVMRTFELPATSACLLTENTNEHREIFGVEGDAVLYFRTISEMMKKLKWLLENEAERHRLARAAHDLIVKGNNTYKDRLLVMLGMK
jgi:spore maturation protein CgeB